MLGSFQDPFLRQQEKIKGFLNGESREVSEVDFNLIVSSLRDQLFEGMEYVVPDFYYLNWFPDSFLDYLFNNNPEVKFKSQSLKPVFETLIPLNTKITNTKDIGPRYLEVLNNILVLKPINLASH